MIRLSYIDSGIGPTIPLSTIIELDKKKATHVSFHSNRIKTLDINTTASTKYRSNGGGEDAFFRNESGRINHLLELDVSSNYLHEGSPSPSISIASTSMKISLLGLCHNLCTLNLSCNNLSEKSLSNLFRGSNASGDSNICLTRLHTLDVSHNNISKLPVELHVICPSLRHLSAQHNKIKSLTSLVQTLHNFRGKMESVQFRGGGGNLLTNQNPVCSKELYHEKVLFILGTNLSKFDGCRINANERDKARRKLESGLSIHQNESGGVNTPIANVQEQECRKPLISRRNEQSQQRQWQRGQQLDDEVKYEEQSIWCHEDTEVLDNQHQQCIQNNRANVEIESLKERVASLSVLVQKQEAVANRQQKERANDASLEKENRPPAVETNTKESIKYSSIRQKTAASYMMRAMLLRQKHEKSILYVAFSLWVLSTKHNRHEQRSNVKYIEAEKIWKMKMDELVHSHQQNASEEIKKSQSKLNQSQEATKLSEKKVSYLKKQVNDLKEKLQYEKKSLKSIEEQSSKALDLLQAENIQLKATMQKEREEYKEHARQAEVELERLKKDLQFTSNELYDERRGKANLESTNKQMSIANQEATELASNNSQQVQQLKLEVIQKDATIQRLKDAYEQAARRSAADKSRCEQALATDQQSKELLRKQTIKLNNVEAEMERLVGENKSRLSTMQSEASVNASKVSSLLCEVDERDRTINNSERRIKSLMNERNEMQKHLTECNRIRSRAEQRNNQLLAQLDQAEDNIRHAKRCSVDKDELEAERLRARDLQQSLDRLRESSHQQELDLQAKNKEMHRDNVLLRNDLTKHEKMEKSVTRKLQMARNEASAREEEIRSHCAEIQKIRDEKEQEILSVRRKFQAEQAIRMELEKKAATFEAENQKQKVKMQSAIEAFNACVL